MGQHALSEFKETLDNRSLISRFTHARADATVKFSAQRNFALQIIQGSEALRNCSPESIHNCLLDVAFTGLSLSPNLSQLYLIPYKGIASLSIGYRGMEQMAYRSKVVIVIQAVLVKENDPEFEV